MCCRCIQVGLTPALDDTTKHPPEIRGTIASRILVKEPGDPVLHGLGEWGCIDGKCRRSCGTSLDHVQTERLALGQAGQEIVDGPVYAPHVLLVAPVAHPV